MIKRDILFIINGMLITHAATDGMPVIRMDPDDALLVALDAIQMRRLVARLAGQPEILLTSADLRNDCGLNDIDIAMLLRVDLLRYPTPGEIVTQTRFHPAVLFALSDKVELLLQNRDRCDPASTIEVLYDGTSRLAPAV